MELHGPGGHEEQVGCFRVRGPGSHGLRDAQLGGREVAPASGLQGLARTPQQAVAKHRSRGVIVDVAALDIIDSFAARSLTTVARTNRLRGAKTVIVGSNPKSPWQ